MPSINLETEKILLDFTKLTSAKYNIHETTKKQLQNHKIHTCEKE